MGRLGRGLAKYCFYPVLRALAVYGQCQVGVFHPDINPTELARQLRPADDRVPSVPATFLGLAGPPLGHPERLTAGVGLSSYEREVLRQLDLSS
ncbi:DUF6059 family protein [Streptacidiphilus anmyonensis]|uniref:DUF6059 family protein n=1 Tax=Streptacidiphilus anmyonensis TaxID=405782 RepID=UPI0005A672FC|nr:DUF6059 family protein [Streptacidiphilus anmyonensis]